MQKPTDQPLSTDGSFDYDLTERIVRQLQESHLHVAAVHVASDLPDALKTGDAARDDAALIVVTLTMLTDGHRGFLVLVDEVPEYDAPFEMTDLLTQLAPGSEPGHTFVVRGATMNTLDPCLRGRTLDLTKTAGVRGEVERAYEEAFAGHGPVDHESFFAAFTAYSFFVHDERSIRGELIALSGD